MDYDVVIAGGSVAGLLCAREIAAKNHKVLVIEEDHEIGTPEHCGGVVSIPAMEDLGIIPMRATLDNKIRSAKIVAPSGKSFTLDARPQQVIVLDRREFDKQIAHQAQVNGAEIRVKSSLREITKDSVRTSDGEIKCKIIVDARGVSSLIQKDRTGTLQSAQYEVFADWIDKERIEVHLDQEKYPGFFAWVIPTRRDEAKIGVAGRGINPALAIEEFLKKKGRHSTIRKIFAPIWIKGPIKEFVIGNLVTIGDAAGQAKPTTAGGIYSSGIGGMLAGRSISKFLESGKESSLSEYQKEWTGKFGKEFEHMLLARSLLERLDNKSVDSIFDSITPKILDEISKEGSFDFHTTSVAKMLGVRGSVKAVQAILGNELRRLLN
ncbi:NAD(P)/FAD-dependent oxidoreductase [Candidatus Nitrosotalea bavarica]|uniref:NAD(P)/FAD-dependent oxidoreductase n=1 Tax=Candidatus Nitrosotalea bavarica TaxID=1903277 RepID=UPI000C70BA17|nr:NAD(P)/FAD-dependent oxidoreductase [Candidatus Nitrosotalea bavarica]